MQQTTKVIHHFILLLSMVRNFFLVSYWLVELILQSKHLLTVRVFLHNYHVYVQYSQQMSPKMTWSCPKTSITLPTRINILVCIGIGLVSSWYFSALQLIKRMSTCDEKNADRLDVCQWIPRHFRAWQLQVLLAWKNHFGDHDTGSNIWNSGLSFMMGLSSIKSIQYKVSKRVFTLTNLYL